MTDTHTCPICGKRGAPSIPREMTWLDSKKCRSEHFRRLEVRESVVLGITPWKEKP